MCKDSPVKTMQLKFTISIGFVRQRPIMYIPNYSSIECIVCTLSYSLTYTHIHSYITSKLACMNSGDLKTCKYIRISKSIFSRLQYFPYIAYSRKVKRSKIFYIYIKYYQKVNFTLKSRRRL